MSQIRDDAKGIRAQIEAHILQAWPDVTEILRNRPRVPATPPYAGTSLTNIPFDLRGLSKLGTLSYDIMGRFPIGPDDDIEDVKLDKAQDLMDLLEATPDYAGGLGIIPLVTNIDFVEHEDGDEYVLDVVLTFEVKTDRPHGSA